MAQEAFPEPLIRRTVILTGDEARNLAPYIREHAQFILDDAVRKGNADALQGIIKIVPSILIRPANNWKRLSELARNSGHENREKLVWTIQKEAAFYAVANGDRAVLDIVKVNRGLIGATHNGKTLLDIARPVFYELAREIVKIEMSPPRSTTELQKAAESLVRRQHRRAAKSDMPRPRSAPRQKTSVAARTHYRPKPPL